MAAWLSSSWGVQVDTAKWGQAVSVTVSFPRHRSLGTPCFCIFLWLLGELVLASPCAPPAPSLTRAVPTCQRSTVSTLPSWELGLPLLGPVVRSATPVLPVVPPVLSSGNQ